MRISVFTREERERKREEQRLSLPARFNLALDLVQLSGDLTYFCRKEVPKAQQTELALAFLPN